VYNTPALHSPGGATFSLRFQLYPGAVILGQLCWPYIYFGRRKGATQILTDIPVKAKLEARQRACDLKKTKIRKRKGLFVNNEHTGNDVDRPNPKKKRKKNNSSKPTSTIADDDDIPCGECGKRCNDPPFEDWKQCLDCQQWFHERCCPEDTDICYTCLG